MLDASIGNRFRSSHYSLAVDFAYIYKTTNEDIIRDKMAFECAMFNMFFNNISIEKKEELRHSYKKLLELDDRALSEERIKKNDYIDKILNRFEIIKVNKDDDNILVIIVNDLYLNKNKNIILNLNSASLDNYIENSKDKLFTEILNEVKERLEL